MRKLTECEQAIHNEFQKYGRNAKEWLRKCQQLLPLIEKYRVWEKRGFLSIYMYAYQLAGMNQNQVSEALRVMKHIENKPALLAVVEKKGLNSIKPVVTCATQENQEFLAEKATIMTKNELETFIRELKKQQLEKELSGQNIDDLSTRLQVKFLPRKASQFGVSAKLTQLGGALEEVRLELSPEVARKLNKVKNNKNFTELLSQFLDSVEGFEEVDDAPDEVAGAKPETVRTDSRHIPVKIKRYVLARAQNQCEFPGCQKPHKIFHHTQRWGLEKTHDPDKIVALCAAHEGIAHRGLIENETGSPDTWILREFPDFTSPKYLIDRQVAGFR